jgi:hypothetical protein
LDPLHQDQEEAIGDLEVVEVAEEEEETAAIAAEVEVAEIYIWDLIVPTNGGSYRVKTENELLRDVQNRQSNSS